MSLKNFILSKLFLKNLGLAAVIVIVIIMILLIWLNLYTRHGQSKPVPGFIGLSLEETDRLAKKSKLRYEITDSIYTDHVPGGCIAEQNPKPGFKVKKWRNIMLIVNAINPEMVAMPNLVNLPKRHALSVIESSGLEIGMLRYIPDISIDVVIKQLHNGREIEEGDSLQKGSTVDLVLGKGLSNQRTPVPNLSGLNLETAKNTILGSSLNLGTYSYDNTIRTGRDSLNAFVYKQNPEFHPDNSLQLGSAIYLWLTVDSAKLTVDSTLVFTYDSIPPADQFPEQFN